MRRTPFPGLLDSLHGRGFTPETVAMDKGYDNGVAMRPTRFAKVS